MPTIKEIKELIKNKGCSSKGITGLSKKELENYLRTCKKSSRRRTKTSRRRTKTSRRRTKTSRRRTKTSRRRTKTSRRRTKTSRRRTKTRSSTRSGGSRSSSNFSEPEVQEDMSEPEVQEDMSDSEEDQEILTWSMFENYLQTYFPGDYIENSHIILALRWYYENNEFSSFNVSEINSLESFIKEKMKDYDIEKIQSQLFFNLLQDNFEIEDPKKLLDTELGKFLLGVCSLSTKEDEYDKFISLFQHKLENILTKITYVNENIVKLNETFSDTFDFILNNYVENFLQNLFENWTQICFYNQEIDKIKKFQLLSLLSVSITGMIVDMLNPNDSLDELDNVLEQIIIDVSSGSTQPESPRSAGIQTPPVSPRSAESLDDIYSPRSTGIQTPPASPRSRANSLDSVNMDDPEDDEIAKIQKFIESIQNGTEYNSTTDNEDVNKLLECLGLL